MNSVCPELPNCTARDGHICLVKVHALSVVRMQTNEVFVDAAMARTPLCVPLSLLLDRKTQASSVTPSHGCTGASGMARSESGGARLGKLVWRSLYSGMSTASITR
jgi:hypothetical protein